MKSFKDYYYDLSNNVPDDSSQFGEFGIGVWQQMVQEGLITTYPKKHIIKYLTDKGLEVEPIPYNPRDDYQHDKIKVIKASVMKSDVSDLSEYISNLKKEIFIFGYHIANVLDKSPYYKLIIEPSFPSEVKINLSLGDFYHITYNFHVDKILKIGLSPRESTTVFSHPGGRVYLIQTKNQNLLNQLKIVLSSSRSGNMLKDNPNLPDKYLNAVSPENMSCFLVDIGGLSLYNDPMLQSEQGTFQAVFTKQNIPPTKLKLL